MERENIRLDNTCRYGGKCFHIYKFLKRQIKLSVPLKKYFFVRNDFGFFTIYNVKFLHRLSPIWKIFFEQQDVGLLDIITHKIKYSHLFL